MFYQQGDVLLKEIQAIPKSAKRTAKSLLHKGQNHHHTLKTGAFSILEDGDKKYVRVSKTTKLTHEEHKTLVVPKGLYEFGVVMEYDHMLEESRQVID